MNNGIRGYINEDEQFLNAAMTFSFGQDTATIFWHEKPYFTGDKIKVLQPKFKCDSKTALYIISALNKTFSIFSWGQQSFSIDVIKEQSILVPISLRNKTQSVLDLIDSDYMHKYIYATEKVAIKNAVQYNDEMIKYTKQIVSAD